MVDWEARILTAPLVLLSLVSLGRNAMGAVSRTTAVTFLPNATSNYRDRGSSRVTR
jgi:uncharacterized membrane protein